MRAIARWALADLRTHRGQAATLSLATAGVTAALLVSAALLQFAASPWQQLFAQTRGHHIWLRLTADADAGALAGLEGVREVSGPYATATITVAGTGTDADQDSGSGTDGGGAGTGTGAGAVELDLRAATGTGPAEARLLSGAGLSGAPGEVLLDRATARALWARPGDVLSPRPEGGAGRGGLRVAGIVESAEAGYDAGERPGAAWASPATVRERTAPGTRPGRTVGLRLDDPSETDFVVQQAVASIGTEDVVRVSTWREARAAHADGHQPAGRLLRVFGLGALLAAAVAVTGGVGTRILGRSRDVSALKALGTTPLQVAAMFLAQHTALAAAGAAAGALGVRTLGAHVPGPVGEAVAHDWALPGAGLSYAGTVAATVLVIAAATALAAGRAARISPSPAARAARPAPRRMSRAARTALRRGVAPPLVLGWRGAVCRRARFAADVARLALPVAMITVALSAAATLAGLAGGEGGRAAPSAPLTVRQQGGLDASQVTLLRKHPRVRAVYPAAEATALIPGQSRSVTLRGLGTDTLPYPFVTVEGRAPATSHEAVAGQGMLDATRAEVGQWVRLTVGGTPHILHIVGRSVEPEHDGLVVTTTLDTLRENGAVRSPQPYALLLRPGADPEAVADELAAALPGIDVRHTPPPVASAALVGEVLVALVAVLALIAVAELAALVSAAVWHHSPELPALRAVGLTPRGLAGVVVAHCAVTATAAALTGLAAGLLLSRPLIDLEGGADGVGPGITLPPPTTSLLLTGAGLVAASLALSVLPSLRAERRRTPAPGTTFH